MIVALLACATQEPAPCLDTDADRLDDCDELELGTDPSLADTDGDGDLDGDELAEGTDPLSADNRRALYVPDLFAHGYDVDRLQIDQDNDGVFDSSHTSVTRKVLGANSYREVISSDYGSDGSAEAQARREIRFRP